MISKSASTITLGRRAVRVATLTALGAALLAGSTESHGETIHRSHCEESAVLSGSSLGAMVITPRTRRVVRTSFNPLEAQAGTWIVPVLLDTDGNVQVIEKGFSFSASGILLIDDQGMLGTAKPLSNWRFVDPDSLVDIGTIAVVYRGAHGRATLCLRFI